MIGGAKVLSQYPSLGEPKGNHVFSHFFINVLRTDTRTVEQ